MQCHVVKIIPANWRKLISDRFYRIRKSKLKNIVTKIVEIQVEGCFIFSEKKLMRPFMEDDIYQFSWIIFIDHGSYDRIGKNPQRAHGSRSTNESIISDLL
jgi:hypothetical protein